MTPFPSERVQELLVEALKRPAADRSAFIDESCAGDSSVRSELEKLLAAHRGGIKTVLIPEDNVKDLTEIPENIKNRLDIHPVKWIDQVLDLAMERKPEALPVAPPSVPPVPVDGDAASTVIKH